MKTTIRMPKVADSVNTVTIIEWHKDVGDRIREGEILLHVETDKAIVEVPSPIGGVIRELLAELDMDVTTGSPIAVLDTD